jgi:tetratricopeptide (TPR) repeat protein
MKMNFDIYMKKEIEKSLFIEIKKDLPLNIKGNPILKKGDYPLLPDDVVNLAKKGLDSIPANAMINGIIYLVACDPNFKYIYNYMEFLKSIEGIENYLIMQIEKTKQDNTKKALVFATTLSRLNPKREFLYNRVILLIELYDKTTQEFIKDEILKSLEELCEKHPDFDKAHFLLGQYYLDKDIDIAKTHLRKCQNDPIIELEAQAILERIKNVEEYDRAIELVKEGEGYDALKILIPICSDNPENLDAKFYAAVALRQTENYEKAIMYLNELTQYAERPDVYTEIGLNLAALNDFEGSIIYFKKALKITPDDSGIICNIGVCHLSLGEIEEAKKAFGLATRINPKDEIAFMWLERLS